MHLVWESYNFDNDLNNPHMPGLIPGFNYDIFISYRQKDNKHDGWVTKFVENLKGELEATFKEDVSVYFDENPHDRLQETHNVDKSLEGKLKCLIFIPIFSQTYCDSNSYAWQYEFLAFNKLAKEDNFGRDIRLRSGNVASRILPIRIHDLEQEDIKLFEKETGSVLRAMDFVFKTSAGVNRPLKVNEDHPQDNLNKTFYADQINKVAHAIKEIISGMKAEPVKVVEDKVQPKGSFKEVREDVKSVGLEKPAKASKVKSLSILAIVALLIVAAIIAYPKIFKQNTLEKLRSSGERISVAVMPFQNMTNDTTKNFWQEMVQDNLITSLSNSEELKVRQTESISSLLQDKNITNYASLTPAIASKVSKKLDASVFIHGSINQIGSIIRLSAKLVDSKTEEIIKSFQKDGTAENILPVIDTLSAMVRDFLIISELKQKKYLAFELSTSTDSPEAYRYFSHGKEAFFKYDMPGARNLLLQAFSIDSNLTYAAFLISFTYSNQGMRDEAKKWCLKLYEKRDQMSLLEKTDFNRLYAGLFETPYENLKYTKQLLEFDDQNPRFWYNLGNWYRSMYQYDNAIAAYERSLEIYNKWNSKPLWILSYSQLGECYHATGQFRKERHLYKKAEKDFPGHQYLIYRQAILALSEGKTKDADEYLEKYISGLKERAETETAIAATLGNIYSQAGLLDKAEEYYRQALSYEPENPNRQNVLAYFLISNERNISEGLDLASRALDSIPDNNEYLHCKGWGLYKQGKYQESLEILQESWNLRREKAKYDHQAYLHLEAAKKAVAGMK